MSFPDLAAKHVTLIASVGFDERGPFARSVEREPAPALRARLLVSEKPMKGLRVSCSTLSTLLMLAAGALAQDVKTDDDHQANFSQYHTYDWKKVNTTDPLWQNEFWMRLTTHCNRKVRSE